MNALHIQRTLKGGERLRLMVVLCCDGQRVEEDEEHHQPIEGLRFHVNQALHPEEAIPATGQTAKETTTTTDAPLVAPAART